MNSCPVQSWSGRSSFRGEEIDEIQRSNIFSEPTATKPDAPINIGLAELTQLDALFIDSLSRTPGSLPCCAAEDHEFFQRIQDFCKLFEKFRSIEAPSWLRVVCASCLYAKCFGVVFPGRRSGEAWRMRKPPSNLIVLAYVSY